MNIIRIDSLLNKYFDGNTTIEEEEELRFLLLKPDLPLQYMADRELFLSFEAQKEIRLNDDFDNALLEKIENSRDHRISFIHRINWYVVSAAAAVILLMLVLFIPMNKLPFVGDFSNKIEDTFDDPKLAYATTMKALLAVSDKFNNGTGQMSQMVKLNKGIANASGFSKLSAGIDDVAQISKFDDGMNDLNIIDKISSALLNAGKLSKIDENKSNINNL